MFFRILGSGKDEFSVKLKNIIGFYPGKTGIYRKALVHKSAGKYARSLSNNNERLEYLGDALLDAVIADYLYTLFKYKDEGFLTKLKSRIVKRKNLDFIAQKIGVPQVVVYHSYSPNHKHIFGNALEALIGAIYIDKGFEHTKSFVINKIIDKYVDIQELAGDEWDFKSKIIEWGQKYKREIIFDCYEKYTDLNKIPFFGAYVKMNGDVLGEGEGKSKKEAEQNAAEEALNYVERLNNN